MLRELVAEAADKIPDGWKTCAEWAKEEGLQRWMAGRYLGVGVEKGLIEMKMFRIKTGQYVRPVPHYRLKK